MWRHARRGDKYVTVIIDLTGIRDGTGPARLLDMVEGRSKQANVRPKREDKRRSNVKTFWRARQDSNPRPAA